MGSDKAGKGATSGQVVEADKADDQPAKEDEADDSTKPKVAKRQRVNWSEQEDEMLIQFIRENPKKPEKELIQTIVEMLDGRRQSQQVKGHLKNMVKAGKLVDDDGYNVPPSVPDGEKPSGVPGELENTRPGRNTPKKKSAADKDAGPAEGAPQQDNVPNSGKKGASAAELSQEKSAKSPTPSKKGHGERAITAKRVVFEEDTDAGAKEPLSNGPEMFHRRENSKAGKGTPQSADEPSDKVTRAAAAKAERAGSQQPKRAEKAVKAKKAVPEKGSARKHKRDKRKKSIV